MHEIAYKWNLKDTIFKKNKGKVFSCFSCGGGSTMGYKLAGFDVIGAVDIDPKMMEAYKVNHKPKYFFVESIVDFANRDNFPKELYDLDILDGSPPCSSFSMAGNRSKDWGKEKKFREGQAEQVLDTLFFDFIKLGKKLQPKIIIAENVKGLLLGEAQTYVRQIYEAFEDAGYYVIHKLLDSSKMGVPQKRERVFFIAVKKDYYKGNFADLFNSEPILNADFDEKKIPFSQIVQKEHKQENILHIPEGILPYWEKIKPGRSCADVHEKGHYFQELKLDLNEPLPTLRAGSNSYYHPTIPRRLYDKEIILGGSFPMDYNFCNLKPIYVVGMSVPPLMTCKLAQKVSDQWLN